MTSYFTFYVWMFFFFQLLINLTENVRAILRKRMLSNGDAIEKKTVQIVG